MNRPILFALVTGLRLMTSAVPNYAHHSFAAEYDRTKTITVTGAVQKLEWTNPHARLFVDGKDETGKLRRGTSSSARPTD